MLTAVSVFLPFPVVAAVSLRTAWLIPSLSRLGGHHSFSLTHPSLGKGREGARSRSAQEHLRRALEMSDWSQRLTGLLTEASVRPRGDRLTVPRPRSLGAVQHLGCGSHARPQGC